MFFDLITKQYKTITANRSGEYLAFDIKSNNTVENEINSIQNTFQNQSVKGDPLVPSRC